MAGGVNAEFAGSKKLCFALVMDDFCIFFLRCYIFPAKRHNIKSIIVRKGNGNIHCHIIFYTILLFLDVDNDDVPVCCKTH